MLIVQIGEAVGGGHILPTDVHIADLHFFGDRHGITQKIAVQITAVIAVVIADEVQSIPCLQFGRPLAWVSVSPSTYTVRAPAI